MRERRALLLRMVLRAPRALFRYRRGKLLGHRFLLLTHVGRTSGKTYETVLEVVAFDSSTGKSVVMSGWGRSSDWFKNVEAAGRARITIGGVDRPVTASVVDEDDAVRLLADYEQRNRLIQPVVRRVLSRLAGSRYDGSEDGRRSLVRALPLVAFSPLSPAAPS